MPFSLQFNQRASVGILIGVIAIFVATAIYVGLQWRSDWQLAHQTAALNLEPVADNSAHLVDQIPDQHLFGQDITATGDMPITNLQLRVTGIARENDANKDKISKAYISISGGPSKIYQVGDSLPDGVKVYEITPDTVILENGGRLEKLPLPREHLQFKPRETKEAF